MSSKIKYKNIKGQPAPQERIEKLSELVNDVGFLNNSQTVKVIEETVSYPVTSVNGLEGDVLLSIPTVKRSESYLGFTDVDGNYSVIYPTVFISVPHIQPELQSGTADQIVRIISSTTNGFTVNVTQKTKANILGVEVVSSTSNPVNSASVSVFVIER